MPKIVVEEESLLIQLAWYDKLLSFHGNVRIPWANITNAYVASIGNLTLRLRLMGTGLGFLKTAGTFTTPDGLIFCCVSGRTECLMVDLEGERFTKLALTLDDDADSAVAAQEITKHMILVACPYRADPASIRKPRTRPPA